MSTILIYQTDKHLRDTMKMSLFQAGHAAFDVADEHELITKGVLEDADLLIVDVDAPSGDGMNVFDRIRATQYIGDKPIIFVTTNPTTTYLVPAATDDRYAILTKPFRIDQLHDTVDEVLRSATDAEAA